MEHRESEAAVKRAAGRRRSSSAPTLWGEDASPRGPRGGRSARPAETGRGQKRPFDIDEAVRLLREAIKPFPAAAMFALKEARDRLNTRDDADITGQRSCPAAAAGIGHIETDIIIACLAIEMRRILVG